MTIRRHFDAQTVCVVKREETGIPRKLDALQQEELVCSRRQSLLDAALCSTIFHVNCCPPCQLYQVRVAASRAYSDVTVLEHYLRPYCKDVLFLPA